jgi:hypothetical protein
VEEYGRELQMPSEVEFNNVDVNEIEGAIPRAWWVLVDLWTVEEGRLPQRCAERFEGASRGRCPLP